MTVRRFFVIVAACVALVASTLVPTGSAAAAPPAGTRLSAGHFWGTRAYPHSPSRRFDIVISPDGYFYLEENIYDNIDGAWGAGDNHHRCFDVRLVMQRDGNLVLYCRPDLALWSTRTRGTGRANYFAVQDDGNLVVYTHAGRAVWASHSGQSELITGQRLAPGQSIRAGESGEAFATFVMQRDGNLVLYCGRRVIWAAGTHTPGSSLNFEPGGNLVMEGPHHRLIWSTHTAGIGARSLLWIYDDAEYHQAHVEIIKANTVDTVWSRGL